MGALSENRVAEQSQSLAFSIGPPTHAARAAAGDNALRKTKLELWWGISGKTLGRRPVAISNFRNS
jgi:hypothetical protein